MNAYANQLVITHGGDQWDAVKKALNSSTNIPGLFTPEEISDVFETINAMTEIENRK